MKCSLIVSRSQLADSVLLATSGQLSLEVKLTLSAVKTAGPCFSVEWMSLTCHQLEVQERECSWSWAMKKKKSSAFNCPFFHLGLATAVLHSHKKGKTYTKKKIYIRHILAVFLTIWRLFQWWMTKFLKISKVTPPEEVINNVYDEKIGQYRKL